VQGSTQTVEFIWCVCDSNAGISLISTKIVTMWLFKRKILFIKFVNVINAITFMHCNEEHCINCLCGKHVGEWIFTTSHSKIYKDAIQKKTYKAA